MAKTKKEESTVNLIAVRIDGPQMAGRAKVSVGLLCGCEKGNEVTLSAHPTSVAESQAIELMGEDATAHLASMGWKVRRGRPRGRRRGRGRRRLGDTVAWVERQQRRIQARHSRHASQWLVFNESDQEHLTRSIVPTPDPYRQHATPEGATP